MTGPLALAAAGIAAGAVAGGWGGAAGGLLMAALLTLTVAIGAAVWAQRIGVHLEVADARATAPCPPGFGRLCRYVYDRTLGGRENSA